RYDTNGRKYFKWKVIIHFYLYKLFLNQFVQYINPVDVTTFYPGLFSFQTVPRKKYVNNPHKTLHEILF
ncbi:hypothetical protein CHH51_09325, partial [Terribacillus saccharophilus]